MLKYFLISLLIHSAILFVYTGLAVRQDINNFYFGSGAAERRSITVGLGIDNTAAPVDYELLGVDELTAYSAPQNLPPEYPAAALRNRWQGESILLLHINKNGLVENCALERSSGYKLLDEAALRAARHWRFPGINKNVQVRFPVKYVLE